jgi:putative transcriptional regulator
MEDLKGKRTEERGEQMDSFQGRFLVAARHQLDPNFAKTVILVCGHTKHAAFGVVVSRSREGDNWAAPRNARLRSAGMARLFEGGPVTGPLMALHTGAFAGERQILPGVFFSRREQNVLTLMRRLAHSCRIFTGYVGWGSGQLDFEVQRGTWRVVPATPEQIFEQDSNLWEQLSVQASRLQLQSMFHIRHFPLDPLLN